jgi:2'-5' RNA ligase
MFYAVVHRPEVDVTLVEDFNRRYNPYHELIGPHVTLLFPVPGEQVREAAVRSRAEEVARQTAPFRVGLNNLELSWDQWLFLIPTDGMPAFHRLHNQFFEGEFSSFLRRDIPFVPHVALGQFALAGSSYSLQDPTAVPMDEDRYQQARAEVERAGLDLTYTATGLELVTVDDEFTSTTTLARYAFGTQR